MNTAIINIKTDPRLKKRAKTIAQDLGFSLSSVINAYLKHFVRTKSVRFSLQDESHPTQYMINALKESRADIKAGRVSPAFDNTRDAIKWLDDNS